MSILDLVPGLLFAVLDFFLIALIAFQTAAGSTRMRNCVAQHCDTIIWSNAKVIFHNYFGVLSIGDQEYTLLFPKSYFYNIGKLLK